MRIIKSNKEKENIFRSIIDYRFFLFQLVKRNITLIYRQTVLGRLWPLINLFLQSGIFTIIFSGLLDLPTDGVPPFLFYMCAMLVWIFFQSNTLKTSQIFTNFASFFVAAYFPRILIPLALILENIIFLIINFFIFISIYFCFSIMNFDLKLNYSLLILIPLIFIYISILSFSIGLIISCLSAKYRDLALIANHGLQLLFFATPIVYSAKNLDGIFSFLNYLNPVSYPVVLIKGIFFSTDLLPLNVLLVNVITCVMLFLIATSSFDKIVRKVVDYA